MLAETFIIIGVMFVAVMGPSVAIAILGSAVLKALARNPSAAPKIFMGMSIMVVLLEAIAIIAILTIFQLFSKGG